MPDIIVETHLYGTAFDALVEAFDIPVEEDVVGTRFIEEKVRDEGADRRFIRIFAEE